MTDPSFRPVLYLKKGCPFCLKLQLYALEAEMLDGLDIREFVPGTPSEAAVRQELDGVLDTVSFPAAQLTPGSYVADSDAIVATLAAASGRDPATLPTYRAYADDVLPAMIDLFKQNHALKSAA